MELENYNSQIARMVRKNEREMIENLPQPEMFGGRRLRQHPLPAMNFSPSSLSVGSPFSSYYGGAALHSPIYGAHPLRDMHGGFGWSDVGNAFKGIAKVAAPVVCDVAKDVGKDLLKSYLTGKGRRGRPRKQHPHAHGGFGWSDVGNAFKGVASVAAPIVADVAKDVGKDMLKSYLTGKGRRGRPRKHGGVITARDFFTTPHRVGGHYDEYGGAVPKWLQSVGNALNPNTSPIAKEVYKDVGTAAALAALGLGHPHHKKRGGVLSMYPVGITSSGLESKYRKYGNGRKHHADAAGGFSFKDIGKALAPVGHFAVNEIIAPVAKDVGKDLLKSAITGKGRKAKAHDGRAKRGEIVKAVMAKHGLSLPAASKFVKEHGLY